MEVKDKTSERLAKAAAKIAVEGREREIARGAANAKDLELTALTQKRRMSQREENRALWQEYFERQCRAHSRLASEYAARAVALQDGGVGSYGS